MRKLKINWSELDTVFEHSSWEMHNYLDLETGEVILVTDETARYLEDPPSYKLPDGQQQAIQVARQVEEDEDGRYLPIPQVESHEGYRVMEDFVATVSDQRAQDQLRQALQGRKPFRRFKDALYDYPAEEKRWFAFSERRLRERMVEWLESEGIQPTNPPH